MNDTIKLMLLVFKFALLIYDDVRRNGGEKRLKEIQQGWLDWRAAKTEKEVDDANKKAAENLYRSTGGSNP